MWAISIITVNSRRPSPGSLAALMGLYAVRAYCIVQILSNILKNVTNGYVSPMQFIHLCGYVHDMCKFSFFSNASHRFLKVTAKVVHHEQLCAERSETAENPPPWQREGRHFKATRIQKTTKACCIILFSTSGFDFIYFIFFRTHCSLQMLSGSLLFFFFFFFFKWWVSAHRHDRSCLNTSQWVFWEWSSAESVFVLKLSDW